MQKAADGEQYTILANQENLTYKSNNNDVAVVSKNGLITAVGEGDAIISVITADTQDTICDIIRKSQHIELGKNDMVLMWLSVSEDTVLTIEFWVYD